MHVDVAAREMAKCAACMGGYKHDEASVKEMKEYAECVRLVHPEAFGPTTGQRVGVGLAMLVCLVCAVGGFLKDADSTPFSGAFLGLMIGFLVSVIVAVTAYGLVFVFG